MTDQIPEPNASRKSDSLEALRGLAAAVVFLGHLSSLMFAKHPWVAPVEPLLNWGTEAVILFFLLSGVVIRLSEERRRRTPGEFALDRIVRIYPLYVVALGLACVAALWLGQELSRGAVLGNLLFAQSLQGYIVPTLPTDPPFWSLSFEMTFYATFALVLLNRRVLTVWGIVALLALCTYPVALPSAWASHFRMIFAFSAIWVLGYLVTQHRDRVRFDRASAIAVLPLAFAWARIKFIPDFYDPFRLVGFGLFLVPLFSSLIGRAPREIRLRLPVRIVLCAAVLPLLWWHSDSLRATKLALSIAGVAGCFFGPALASRLRIPRSLTRTLVYLGSISYALYVVHYPIVLVTLDKVGNAGAAVAIIVTLVLALSHFLERVMQPRITRAVRRLRAAAPAPAEALTVPG